MTKYFTAITIIGITILINQASALKCWRCTSDATGAAFCNDPFETDLISEQQRRWSYVDCSFPPQAQLPYGSSSNMRPVCKKMKQVVQDKLVVSRACSWEDVNAPTDACLRQNTPSYIKTEFCETCTEDGCNGASQYGPTLLLLIIPAIIAKLLTL
ncbi:uncharacterized protein LOC134829383 [Culicoides brevitarsis]|uniref:uncharacterized protein LOC134829383 n=1 Tax=Culicoides brevitarsis TaxID=469753 RepID=UPI00307BB71D